MEQWTFLCDLSRLFEYLHTYAGIDILPIVRPRKSTAPRGMKPLEFLGSSRDDLCAMPAVGTGAYEIRVRDESGAYRAIYVAKFEAAVYVLHAFHKKTQQTAKMDIELAKARYRLIRGAS